MRTGVVDVSGQGVTLHVFDHDVTGATAVMHKTVTLHLKRHERGMVLAPGLLDLAAETVRRFAAAADAAGCTHLRVTLDDELADADELADRLDLAVVASRTRPIGEKPCTLHGSDPFPARPAAVVRSP